ncbi:MAG: PQQ-binding-like beta-propeller repeat protein [Planctomycetota bacterium]
MMNRLILSVLMLLPITSVESAALTGQDILEATGVRGGLVVHLGCGDGSLTMSLRANDAYVVHGLDTDPENVRKARSRMMEQDLYGPVSVDQLRGRHLPYIDNLVNLVVARDPGEVPVAEIMRVLAPGGTAYIQDGDTWRAEVKPRPKEIDEWTHYLHDASNNAVADDQVVGPPRRMQWCGGPRYARHHDHMSSLTAAVTAGGRVFYIMDEAPRVSILTPPEWKLVARDAFNGTVLWKRDIPQWYSHLHRLKSGPSDLPRRLIAKGERVYATLGIDAPISALDAATGETIQTYDGTEGAEGMVLSDGMLFVRVGESEVRAVNADTGAVAWSLERPVVKLSLAANSRRVVFMSEDRLVCLDREDGEVRWESEQLPRPDKYTTRSGPTLVLYEDLVLLASSEFASAGNRSWKVGKPDTLTVLSAADGHVLWDGSHPLSGYASAEDLFVIDGVVWCGETTSGHAVGTFIGRDAKTGEVTGKFDPDVETYWFHHRCHRSKATERFILTSRTGIEFVDFKNEHWDINHWVRGACLYGAMPGNGLLYAPQHPCACFAEAKLDGFNALAPASKGPRVPEDIGDEQRLLKGPAYGAKLETEVADADWPTYRHDGARSGRASTDVPVDLKTAWQAEIGGKVSSPVIAGGMVFVAGVDTHGVHALDATTGEQLWQYTAGGRIDSPPSVYRGLVLFGSADGHVYALRGSDGALVWRFRAAPIDQRHTWFDQLESVWPVHGSVLVEEGVAWFVAGRSMFLDGGLRLYRLDPVSGRVLSENVMDRRGTEEGKTIQDYARQHNMPVALPDILSSDGRFVYMRSQAFQLDGERLPLKALPYEGNPERYSIPCTQDPKHAHLFSPTGFLDDSWWHRTYWVYGSRFTGGWAGYSKAGKVAPAGKILVFDDARVYGYGRLPKYYRWTTTLEHQLFRTTKSEPVSSELSASVAAVEVGNSPSLDVADTPLTIEAWIHPEKPSGVVLARGGHRHGCSLYLQQRRPAFAVRIDGDVRSVKASNSVKTGQWVHLAGVLTEDEKIQVFVDGELAGVEDAKSLIVSDPSEGMEIGADKESQVGNYKNSMPFTGLIDEVRLYRRALDADEMATRASGEPVDEKDSGLAAWYSFDEEKTRDRSGNGNHANVEGMEFARGKVGMALNFTGEPDASATVGPEGNWTLKIPLMPRGMVLAGERLFIAGPPDLVDEEKARPGRMAPAMQAALADQNAAFRGEKGAMLWAVSAKDARKLSEMTLDSPPVFDGMAAASERLYVVTMDGKVLCLEGK